MDLTILKNYFDACFKAESQLQDYWHQFEKLPSFALFKLLATQSQHKIDVSHIKKFMMSFNWQTLLNKKYFSAHQPNYKIHSISSQMNSQQLLDFGLDLMVNYWGSDKNLTFDQFTLIIKGEHQLPSKQKQIAFPNKKLLFQCLINELQSLIYIEEMKKKVYYQYKNLTDLFETITSSKLIQYQNIQRLFLSFGDRKNQKQIQRICKRGRIPWDFNTFLTMFKRSSQSKATQIKINYSSRRNKDQDNLLDKAAFTTPRKQKYLANQSSTKVAKGQFSSQVSATPTKINQITEPQTGYKQQKNYIQILANLLELQQDFINSCINLVNRKDFDLELAYQRHGKKFQKLLNTRYGVCNFSAFTRFIIPRDFEHRYLSFIRYQANNTISSQTQQMINQLLQKYQQKQQEIKQLWKICDKQLLLRFFCQPRQTNMKNQKLRQYFTTRQTKIILQRLDPHGKGYVQLQAIK